MPSTDHVYLCRFLLNKHHIYKYSDTARKTMLQ